MLFRRIRFLSAVVRCQSDRPRLGLDRAAGCFACRPFLRVVVVDVPFEMPVEKILIRAEQERAGTAGRIEDLCSFSSTCLRLVLSSDQLPHRILDDVIDDVLRRVIDAAGFSDLGLFLHLRLMPCCEPNDLAEELLVHLAEDVGGEDGEFVRAFGIVEPVDDVFKRLVVNRRCSG